MHGEGTVYDPNQGGDIEAHFQLADDGLYIFDHAGRRVCRWRFEEIEHAFAARQGSEQVLVSRDAPEIRANVTAPAVYDAIALRAPRLRRRNSSLISRFLGGVSFSDAWSGVPDQAQTGIILGLVFGAVWLWSWVAGLLE